VAATLIAVAASPRSSAAEARCQTEDWVTYTGGCPEDWSCLRITEPGLYQWGDSCNPIGVELLIQSSDVTLDCEGGSMKSYPSLYPRAYFDPIPTWDTNAVRVNGGQVSFGEQFDPVSCRDMDADPLPTQATDCQATGQIDNIRIANCSIEGYTHGVVIEHADGWSTKVEDRIIAEYEQWYRDPEERVCRVTQIEDCLRAGAPRDIELDRVHIRNSEKNGVHVRSYVQDVHFHHGSVRDTGGGDPGIYLTYGSRRTTIAFSEFTGNGREAIAIDSSADNRIHDNLIVDNGKPAWAGPWTDADDRYGAGITVFRNAWEGRYRVNRSPPRAQHASGNRIERNDIRDQWVGVWIGYRQDDGPPSERDDPVYYDDDGDKYYRHHAEHTTVNFNWISGTRRPIVIEDDTATVAGNWITLSVFPSVGIDLGSWVRRRAGDPVRQSIIDGNTFIRDEDWHVPIRVKDCAVDNVIEGNHILAGGVFAPVGPAVGSCDRARMRLRFHRTRADSTYEPASGHQQGGPFGRARDWLVGDFDDDGIDDLLHAYTSDDDQVRLWVHAGTGEELEYQSSFQTFPEVVFGASDDRMRWVAGEFDGAAGDDLVLVSTPSPDSTASNALRWKADGSGLRLLGSRPIAASLQATETLWLAADVDADGIDELILAYRTPDNTAVVEIYSSNANLEFTPLGSQTIGAWLDGQRWVAGDIDGDGRDDLLTVFSAGLAGGLGAVHLSTGTDFTPFAQIFPINDSGGGEAPLSSRDRWLATDFDGDGDDDLVRVAPLGDAARVSRYRAEDGVPGFASTDTLGDFHDDQAWLAGDFDCGSRPELVVVEGLGDWGTYAPMADADSDQICDSGADSASLPMPSGLTEDIVWQSSNRQMHYWSMVDGQRIDGYNLSAPVHPAWVPRGVGDLDGDGHDDIVFRQDNGQVHYWPMRGGERLGGIDIYAPVSDAWTLRGVGDVDGDGTDDIIWQAANGQVHYWPMRDGQRLNGIDIYVPVSDAWTLRAVGDVDGDGTDDIIWQHSSGQVHYWPMQNGQRQNGLNIYSPVSGGFALRAAGDIDGDGTDDIIWQRSSGQVHYWSMRDGQRQDGHDVLAPAGDGWTLVGAGKMDGLMARPVLEEWSGVQSR
jgi:hypothetical protein